MNTVMEKTLSNALTSVPAPGIFSFAPITAQADGCYRIHDADCNCAESAACNHQHDKTCGENGAACLHVH